VNASALRAQGWTISAIARHLERDRKTIRAYLAGDRQPRGALGSRGRRRRNSAARRADPSPAGRAGFGCCGGPALDASGPACSIDDLG
jgi:predicted transcriptional regulator